MSNNFYFAALEACSVTNAAAVETTSRTIFLPPGGSLGPWRPSIKTADPEGLLSICTCYLCWRYIIFYHHTLHFTSLYLASKVLYNFQIMLSLLRRTPALLPRANAKLITSESIRPQPESPPAASSTPQNPLDSRDYFGGLKLYNFKIDVQ